MRNKLKITLLRESLIMLALLGGGFLLLIIDALRSRYPVINAGVANLRYFPTTLGEIGVIIFFLYPFYLIIRLVIWVIRKKDLKKLVLFCLVALLCFFSAGCYETQNEIILSSQGMRIEGFPQSYNGYTITRAPGSNDYRYLKPAENNSPAESGYMRVVLLRDNIYIAQVKDDSYRNFIIMFLRLVNGPGGGELQIVSPKYDAYLDDVSRYGIKVNGNDWFGAQLNGSRGNIMGFLKAHTKATFTNEIPEVSKIKDKIINAVK